MAMRLDIDELDLILCLAEKEIKIFTSHLTDEDLKLGPRTKDLYEDYLTKLENLHIKLSKNYFEQVAIRDRDKCKKETSVE